MSKQTGVFVGSNPQFDEGVVLGYPRRSKTPDGFLYISDNALIRSGTVIYYGTRIGKNFQCGHDVIIREQCYISDNVMIGTKCVLEKGVKIRSGSRLQTGVYLSTGTDISHNVFIGPNVTFLNDKYPPSDKLEPATVHINAVIGGGAIILPGVVIGKNAFVAAGTLVTKDVPRDMMAIGTPAVIKPKPKQMQ